MLWRWALFRRTRRVLALCDEAGRLLTHRGRVEIRFSLVDPRAYRARPCNVRVLGGEAPVAFGCLPPGVSPRTGKPRPSLERLHRPRRRRAAVEVSPPSHADWIVHADASYGKGRAGAGIVVVTPTGEILERALALGVAASSMAAEAAALREALALVPDGARVAFFSDCLSLVEALARAAPRHEPTIVAELRRGLLRFETASVHHVRGHAGHPLNERADALALQARRQASGVGA